MIVPWLKGMLNFTQAPLTWTLCAINVLIFLMTLEPSRVRDDSIFKAQSLETMAILYGQYQAGMKPESKFPPREEVYLMGLKALRDKRFLDQIEHLDFVGDPVLISEMKEMIIGYRDHSGSQTIKMFGLTDWSNGKMSWLTYQFMHAGWVHLFSNLLLLLIFAGALESLTNSLFVIGVYLIGGMGGACGFLWWVQSTAAPMVGASASLSAVMACYAVLQWRKRVQFFYFFSPFEGHHGWLYLPTWLIFPLGFAGDLGAILSTDTNISVNVAYSAHLGGALTGILIAVVMRLTRLEQSLGASYSQSPS